jgi:hypothetical protein
MRQARAPVKVALVSGDRTPGGVDGVVVVVGEHALVRVSGLLDQGRGEVFDSAILQGVVAVRHEDVVGEEAVRIGHR